MQPRDQDRKPEHAESCTYARLGLAGWRGAPARFAGFGQLMWEGKQAPPIDSVRNRAAELVGGSDALDTLLADPFIDAEITQGVKLFQFTNDLSKSGTLPKLLFSTMLISGRLDPPSQLFNVLEQRL